MAFHNKEMTARAKVYSEMPILRDIEINHGKNGKHRLKIAQLYAKSEVRESYLEGNMAFCVGDEKFGEARCKKRGVDQKGAFPICVETPDGVGCAACHWDSQGRQCALYVGKYCVHRTPFFRHANLFRYVIHGNSGVAFKFEVRISLRFC